MTASPLNLGPGSPPPAKAVAKCAPIAISSAKLVRRGDRVVLKVAGHAPFPNMALELRPVVYVMQPDYWLMALVGCVPKGTVKPAAPAEFAAELDMHVALGRKGVDLSGDANGNSLRLELPD